MKITIEPSAGDDAHYHQTVTYDTRTNCDSTREAVQAMSATLIAFGHNHDNVAEAEAEYAEINKPKIILGYDGKPAAIVTPDHAQPV